MRKFCLESVPLAPAVVVHEVVQRQAIFPAHLLEERLGAKLRRVTNAEIGHQWATWRYLSAPWSPLCFELLFHHTMISLCPHTISHAFINEVKVV